MTPRRETLPYRQALGRAVLRSRERKGMSQEELGFRAEVDRTYISGLEGGTRNPTLETLLRVSKALGVKLSTLIQVAEREP